MDIPISLKGKYNNVKVDIYEMEFNTELSRNILSDTPVISGVYMSIIEKEDSKETGSLNGFDKDRINMYSVACEYNIRLLDYLKAGNVLEVTHSKAPMFGNYAIASTTKRYMLSKMHTHSPTSTMILGTARSFDEQ